MMAKKKNSFNSVTTFSKFLAFIMFVSFPFVGLYFGMQYQKALDKPFMEDVLTVPTPTPGHKACTAEALRCPDGTYVGRSGPNCEFQKCPGDR